MAVKWNPDLLQASVLLSEGRPTLGVIPEEMPARRQEPAP